MPQRLNLLAGVLLSLFFPRVSAWGQANPSQAELAARLTLMTPDLHEGDQFKVRAEIQNVSNHPVLIGRELNLVSDMPFRMEIWLEDLAGRHYIVSGGASVDFLVLPDLQVANGILLWKAPLYPKMFLGTDFTLDLRDVAPGKYKIRGRYIVLRPPHEETEMERKLVAAKFTIFQGMVEANSIDVEVLPKRRAEK